MKIVITRKVHSIGVTTNHNVPFFVLTMVCELLVVKLNSYVLLLTAYILTSCVWTELMTVAQLVSPSHTSASCWHEIRKLLHFCTRLSVVASSRSSAHKVVLHFCLLSINNVWTKNALAVLPSWAYEPLSCHNTMQVDVQVTCELLYLV